MSKVRVDQLTEFFRQVEAGRITSEVIQEVLENAGKMHLRKVMEKYLQKAVSILERTPSSEFMYGSAMLEVAVAEAMAGKLSEARERVSKIEEAYRRAHAFARIGSITHKLSDFTAAKKAAEEEEGWSRIRTLLKIKDERIKSGDDSEDKIAFFEVVGIESYAKRLPDPTPNTNSEDEYCESLALELRKIGYYSNGNKMAERSGKFQEYLAHLVEYFVSKNELESAKMIKSEINNVWAKISALTHIALYTKSDEDLKELRQAISQIPNPDNRSELGFTHAKFAGTLAEFGLIDEAVGIAKKCFPSAESESYCRIAEALTKKHDFDNALNYLGKARNEHGIRSRACHFITIELAKVGDYQKARLIANEMDAPYYAFQAFAQIGTFSLDEIDFSSAYQLIQQLYKKSEFGKAECLAKLVQIMATAIK